MGLFDSELKVMNVLWEQGDLSASAICKILNEAIGWNRNTTYTIIKKCVDKKYVQRSEPSFMCHAIITREQAQERGISDLMNRLFQNSRLSFFHAFLKKEHLTKEEIAELKNMIDKLK